jgi:hypothetical protein
MTFLRMYSLSAVGLNFLLSAVVTLLAVLCVGAMQQVGGGAAGTAIDGGERMVEGQRVGGEGAALGLAWRAGRERSAGGVVIGGGGGGGGGGA